MAASAVLSLPLLADIYCVEQVETWSFEGRTAYGAGIGISSSGGFERKRDPIGAWTVFANFSSCFNVGCAFSFSHSWYFGNRRTSMSASMSARSRAQRNNSGLILTRIIETSKPGNHALGP